MFKQIVNYVSDLPRKLQSSKNTSVFLVCLALSALFWLLIKLSKEHTTTITVPVVYTDMPNDKLLVNELPTELKVEITTYGFKLLRYSITGKRTAKISVANLDIRPTTAGNEYWLPNTQKSIVAKFFPTEVKIGSITPDKILFTYSMLELKRVPVKTNISIDLPKQFALSSAIRVEPEYINVRGPKNILDTLKAVYTEGLEIKSKPDNNVQQLQLKTNNQLKYEQGEVSVTIPIDEYTEVYTEVPITPINVPEGEQLKLYPDKVKVYGLMGMKTYYELLPEDFEIVCDYRKIDFESNSVKLELTEYPNELKSLRFTPQRVEYLIFK